MKLETIDNGVKVITTNSNVEIELHGEVEAITLVSGDKTYDISFGNDGKIIVHGFELHDKKN